MAIVEVVKYNGGSDVFAWKYPNQELGTWTQLIVNESQEAILYKGGKALDLFESGKHTLSTENIPILNKIVNIPFGGKSPFAAEVWYVNKVYSLDIKWGTATPIQIQDPKYKVFLPIRSFGQFGIQIEDSRKFLVKLVGTMTSFDKDTITKYFRGLYITRVKDAISSYLVHKEVSVLEINAYLNEISDYLQEKMCPILNEYGIKLVNFYVNDISVPEEDSTVKNLKEALSKKAEMDIIGYNYQQQRSFDTLEGAATNPSSGQAPFMGAGLGLGMGVGLGGAMGNQFANIARNISVSFEEMKNCPQCDAIMEKATRFCGECGYDSLNRKEEKSDDVKCTNCGTIFSKKMKFCPECGNKYNACPKCGADIADGDNVCPECGYKKAEPCPKCGYNIENENAKFCPECGTPLIKRCPTCQGEIKGTPKFCPECGGKL